MKNRLYLVSPKLKMALSAILLICSFFFLWSSLQFAMPTALLAIKKAEAEQGLTSGKWELYRPSVNPKSNTSGWYFSRQGDEFYIAQGFKDGGPFWNDALGPYPIAPLSPYYLNFNPIFDTSQEIVGYIGNEGMILITTSNPAVTRVELVQGSRMTDCTESAPGSGFWVGILRTMDTDKDKDLPLFAHAYDAAGSLIASTEP